MGLGEEEAIDIFPGFRDFLDFTLPRMILRLNDTLVY